MKSLQLTLVLVSLLVPSVALAESPPGPRLDAAEAPPALWAPAPVRMRRRSTGLIAGGGVVGAFGLGSAIFGSWFLASFAVPPPGPRSSADSKGYWQATTAFGGAFLGTGLLALGGGAAMIVRGAQLTPVVSVGPTSAKVGFRF